MMRADILYPGNRVIVRGDAGDYGHELPNGTTAVLLHVDEWDSLIQPDRQDPNIGTLTFWVDNKDLQLVRSSK